jgi:serine/threonine protein kinase
MREDGILGQMIEGYQIISQIGEGAMGRVYLAKHPMIGKRIAIKILKPELVRTHVQMTRFLREAQTVNEIGHQNVVDIFNFVYHQESKKAYILMEFLDGQTLAEVIERESPLPVKRVAYIGQQICSALFAAHERGIVHRDLKPENVFLTERAGQKDFVKLIDFGLAKLLESSDVRSITFNGALLGTPAYMSPEQALGEPIDLRADLYSLGLVLYEATTGVLPFASNTLQETLAGRLLFQAPPMHTYCADISPAFEAVILQSLSKRREGRFSSAKEMGEQLSLAAKSEPLQFSRPQSKEYLYAKSLANNPWDEPEFTMHQDVSREDNSHANAALSLQKTDPLISARTLMVENPLQEATWNNPSSQKFELQEVLSVEERSTIREKRQPRRPPVTFDECLSSQEIPTHEFIIEEIVDDNDVDVPTENSREKPRLK